MYRLILPFFLTCMAGAIGLFIVSPQYDEVRQRKIEEAALLQDLEDVKTINARVDDLRAQHAKFPPGAEAKLDVLLPKKVDSVRYMVDVNALVEAHGLQMRSPSVSVTNPPQGATGVDRMAKSIMRFEVVASYDEFRALLSDLEHSLALRDVTSMTFNAGEVAGAPPRYNKNKEIVRSYFIEIGTYSFN